ncbi:kinase-like domain-containing protein [Nemania sp. FL0916]|nr:kinase-like domain-containing protein [Nemania sp. FL0916]
MAPQNQMLAMQPAAAMSSSSAPRPSSDAHQTCSGSPRPSRSSAGPSPSSPTKLRLTTTTPATNALSPTTYTTTLPFLPAATPATPTSSSLATYTTNTNYTTTNSSDTTTSIAASAPRPIPVASSQTKTGYFNPSIYSGISDINRSLLPLTIGLIIPPAEPAISVSPLHSPVHAASWPSAPQASAPTSAPTPADSLRRHPTDLTTPIPEECDEETCSESLPNDPVTPVSGRQSRDFRFCDSHDLYHRDSVPSSVVSTSLSVPEHADDRLGHGKDYLPTTFRPSTAHARAPAAADQSTPVTKAVTNTESPAPSVTPRPPTRRSSSTLSRAMSSLFKRHSHHGDDNSTASSSANASANASAASSMLKNPGYSTGTSETSLAAVGKMHGSSSRRRFSYHRSVATTRSNTPPSPGSPLEMALVSQHKGAGTPMPTSRDFLCNNAKKNSAPTGLSLRQKVNFVSIGKNPRRTRSLERKPDPQEDPLTRQPWAIPPDAGTGMKARRLSLSLPDDFTIDIADLLKEYEYHHKFLGRHGKHLGKGATSKVTLMVRKGAPGELYAVKEFRGKGSNETPEEYQKKIKSEYSIAKSLHHPNVVETIRLCTDHGRWNHVMEYCSEGDLFSLVSKGYLRKEEREVDRLCLFKQLCQGINYLHTNGIAHRDIKLENLLITKDSKLKITDFGVSEVFSGIHPGLRESGGQCGVAMGEVRFCKPGICGSLPYIAPEVLQRKEEYDPRALDVWGSAIVMIHLIFGASLWEKAEEGGAPTYDQLVAGWRKSDAKNATKADDAKESYPRVPAFDICVKPLPLRRLLLSMLHPDPKKRITMNAVVTHRWMKNVECCQLESYDDPVKYIDASKKDCMKGTNGGKIFCHNHLPPMSTGHGLPPMPGKPGY